MVAQMEAGAASVHQPAVLMRRSTAPKSAFLSERPGRQSGRRSGPDGLCPCGSTAAEGAAGADMQCASVGDAAKASAAADVSAGTSSSEERISDREIDLETEREMPPALMRRSTAPKSAFLSDRPGRQSGRRSGREEREGRARHAPVSSGAVGRLMRWRGMAHSGAEEGDCSISCSCATKATAARDPKQPPALMRRSTAPKSAILSDRPGRQSVRRSGREGGSHREPDIMGSASAGSRDITGSAVSCSAEERISERDIDLEIEREMPPALVRRSTAPKSAFLSDRPGRQSHRRSGRESSGREAVLLGAVGRLMVWRGAASGGSSSSSSGGSSSTSKWWPKATREPRNAAECPRPARLKSKITAPKSVFLSDRPGRESGRRSGRESEREMERGGGGAERVVTGPKRCSGEQATAPYQSAAERLGQLPTSNAARRLCGLMSKRGLYV